MGWPADDSKSPAAQLGARQIYGESLYDPKALRELVEGSDVTTWEVEHVGARTLIELEGEGHNIQPSPRSLLTMQDKLHQKNHYVRNGLPVGLYSPLDSANHLDAVKTQYDNRAIIKARTGGFDGRGNHVLEPEDNWESLLARFSNSAGERPELYAEKLVGFDRELAVIGARDILGHIAMYPVLETIHKNSICHTVIAPAQLEPYMLESGGLIGQHVLEIVHGAGVAAVELFNEKKTGRIKINETALRVHNSGHLTIDWSQTSQFENHLRAITGMSLGPTGLKNPTLSHAVMINILRAKMPEKGKYPDFSMAQIDSNVHVHGYGKLPYPDGRPRKIGHITALATSAEEAMELAQTAAQQIENDRLASLA